MPICWADADLSLCFRGMSVTHVQVSWGEICFAVTLFLVILVMFFCYFLSALAMVDVDKDRKICRKVCDLTTEQILGQDEDGDTWVLWDKFLLFYPFITWHCRRRRYIFWAVRLPRSSIRSSGQILLPRYLMNCSGKCQVLMKLAENILYPLLMTRLDFGGQRSRSQQAVDVVQSSTSMLVKVHLLIWCFNSVPSVP